MSDQEDHNVIDQWIALAGHGESRSRWVEPSEAIHAFDALKQLQAKPGVLVLDDLTGLAGDKEEKLRAEWETRINALNEFFDVSCPVLPVHKRHAEKGKTADDLLPIVRDEISRLRRPLAAVVDMQWQFCDRPEQEKERWFGLELIRLIRRVKPSLPVFVWSPIQDKYVLQRAMQLGASSCFDKPKTLQFNHDLPANWKPYPPNELDAAKLWFRLLEWEMVRYNCPPVGVGDGDFILAETPDTVACKNRFLKDFGLTESDLRSTPEPSVERLLRALVPNAVGVEILRFFGEGQSSLERPFVVHGLTATGRWLRPVQIKLSKDWRALAREGKGYRDVFAGCLGPSVAHVLTGPYRVDDWCGMAQSFAAPEEAIRDIASKSTRSLEAWLRKKLPDANQCRILVDDVFDGVLDPLFKGNLAKRAKSVIKAFDRVSPPHLELPFVAAVPEPKPEGDPEKNSIDLNPQKLSRKGPRARREAAFRAWQMAEKWWNNPDSDKFTIRGMEIESLEINQENPVKSRLRLLDPTIGIKVDLFAGEVKDDSGAVNLPKLWESLQKSPIKLVGMPVSFAIKRPNENQLAESKPKIWKCLLNGWTISVEKLLDANGVLKSHPAKGAWTSVERFMHPAHPIDWSEDFHVGPTHGDLNLGNILLHEKGDSLFPWLIDFDKAADQRPVVFDLAKLEIEAYHKIAQDLFWELLQSGCVKDDAEVRALVRRFEQMLGMKEASDPAHLWERFRGRRAVPNSLKSRFAGLLAYFKRVHKRVEDLGIASREFLVGRSVYALCCLKFKHLYQAGVHPNAPFPAKVLLWKLEALLEALDAENGIVPEAEAANGSATWSVQQRAIRAIVMKIRDARREGKTESLRKVLQELFSDTSGPLHELETLAPYKSSSGWERLLRLLRDKQIPGKGRWIRELLWYARDFGLADSPQELADFTRAMVLASQESGDPQPPFKALWDYASTGRLGNIYPSLEMFKHLADARKGPLIKVSSRGESGGTIDILEQAGIPICKSRATVDQELIQRGWAVVETSEHLCEVDKVLMDIRKECHCMKVTELAMSSISAKKAALGIKNFRVQVVSGYDAKFAELIGGENSGKLGVWPDVWKALISDGEIVIETDLFRSSNLNSWFSELQGKETRVVLGKSLLAANIWSSLDDRTKTQLTRRLPAAFCSMVDKLGVLLKAIAEHCQKPLSPDQTRILDLRQVKAPPHLAELQCFKASCQDLVGFAQGLAPNNEDSEKNPPPSIDDDLCLIVFQFSKDFRQHVHVDYLEHLLDEISRSGHPMSALIFGEKWMAALASNSDLPTDLQAWCWRILRDGFRHAEEKKT